MDCKYELSKHLDEKLSQIISQNSIIPKPQCKEHFKIKGLGKRRGKKAIIYYIPNHKNINKPYQKGITIDELKQAYTKLIEAGELTRKWFNENLAACAKEGGCNFTTIGGIFELLEIATYSSKGCYKKV